MSSFFFGRQTRAGVPLARNGTATNRNPCVRWRASSGHREPSRCVRGGRPRGHPPHCSLAYRRDAQRKQGFHGIPSARIDGSSGCRWRSSATGSPSAPPAPCYWTVKRAADSKSCVRFQSSYPHDSQKGALPRRLSYDGSSRLPLRETPHPAPGGARCRLAPHRAACESSRRSPRPSRG